MLIFTPCFKALVMESTNYDMYQKADSPIPERPDFLKILCILSFVACGLWILVCAMGTIVLTFDAATIDEVWEQVIERSPTLKGVEPVALIHSVGMWCVYILIATIFSLIGVIMMWRLEKIGFFVYAVAELSTNLFKLEMGDSKNAYGGAIMGLIIDLVFIGMYFANLKYMNKKNGNTFIQSGT